VAKICHPTKITIGPTLYTDKGYRISVKTIYKIYEVYGISFCIRFKKNPICPIKMLEWEL
jgi:hypothetical protein